MHRAMIDVVDALDPEELVAVARFLGGMIEAVELADADAHGVAADATRERERTTT
jgi:hypothetical protein